MGLVSLIVPCYLLPDRGTELLTFTQNCVESIQEYTKIDYELIIVDNGSPVGVEYMKAVADTYVANGENLGYAAAINQGIRAARGEWLVAVNNDVTFIHDWVSNAIANWDRGMTGVISSHLHDHDPQHRVGRQVVPWGHFFGALWMTHRSIISKVGVLDESYGPGMYEDKDWVRRVLATGYELVKCGWCNHVGNATWGKIPNQHIIFEQNRERFEAKWGRM